MIANRDSLSIQTTPATSRDVGNGRKDFPKQPANQFTYFYLWSCLYIQSLNTYFNLPLPVSPWRLLSAAICLSGTSLIFGRKFLAAFKVNHCWQTLRLVVYFPVVFNSDVCLLVVYVLYVCLLFGSCLKNQSFQHSTTLANIRKRWQI